MKESGKIFLRIPDSLISTYSNLLCIRLFLQDEKAGIYGNSFGCYTDDSAFYASIRSDWKYNYSYETDFPPYRADYKVLSHLHDRILKMSNFPFSGIFWYDAPEEGIENRDRITAEVLSYFSSGAEKYILTPPLSPLDSILAPDVYATNDSLLQIMAERIPAEIIILNNTGCWNYSGRDFESHSE
jgi:hypothetical protein